MHLHTANSLPGDPQPRRSWNRWRVTAWSLAAGLILLPLVAMLFTQEVNWGPGDFVFACALVGGVGATFELAVRMTTNRAFRAGTGLALAGAFLMIWINLAVGIIGSEDNPANLMYFGVLSIGALGVLIARFRPSGMSRALLAMAVAQVIVFVVALVAGFGFTGPITVFFGGLWLASAWLFHRAARQGLERAAG